MTQEALQVYMCLCFVSSGRFRGGWRGGNKYINKPINNLVIRTKEKGRVNFSFQDEFPIILEELISYELMQLDNNLLINNVMAKYAPLSISKSDTVIIEQFVDDYRSVRRSC